MSQFSACWTFLFLIFDAPYLKRFGIFSIPLSIIFFPSTEFIAFEPILIPGFAKFVVSPFQNCAPRNFLFFYSSLSCLSVFTRANLTFYFLFCLFVKRMVLPLDTLMFPGKFFVLTLSYLPTKDVPLGMFLLSGTAHFPSTIFCLSFAFFFFYRQKCFNIGFATSPRSGAAADAKSPIGNPFPLCFLYLFPHSNLPNSFSYRLFSCHSNKSSSV